MNTIKNNSRLRFVLLMVMLSVFLPFCKKAMETKDVILITGTETKKLVKFTVEQIPSSFGVTATTTSLLDVDVTVDFKIDPSLVATYNDEMSSNFYPAPIGSYEISGTSGTIKAGTSISTPVVVRIISTANFVDGRSYLIPVTIQNVTGPLPVLNASRTIYLKVARVIQFTSIDISNFNFYASYPLPNPVTNIKEFTFEVKCYVDQWHTGSPPISRLCNWGPVDESMFNLLRFGEAGTEINQLQWINSSGSCLSKTLFALQRWYTISCVYDGSTCKLYIDGVLDNSFDASGQAYTLGALELGMSFAGYQNAQRFLGRVAEIRFWTKALTKTTIQEGLCGVDAAADGLLAYWKLNEGTGNTFLDITGHGRTMNWPKTVAWSTATNNKCAQ
jgi:hypothetical protein